MLPAGAQLRSGGEERGREKGQAKRQGQEQGTRKWKPAPVLEAGRSVSFIKHPKLSFSAPLTTKNEGWSLHSLVT
eukprot:3911468-Pyramimonas_sp.AAC.1